MPHTPILQALETDLNNFNPATIKPLPCDKWIASSVLQKATRRGLVDVALRAGFTLWHQDKANFWRRVHVMSCEDVGVAAPDVVVQVLVAYANTTWRSRMGDLKVGLYLIKLMCEADKTRCADELYAIAGFAPAYQLLREQCFFASDAQLVDLCLDHHRPLVERALALWLLAGTDSFPHDNLPKRRGNLILVAQTLQTICEHDVLAQACIRVVKRTQWPLLLFTPLIYQALVAPLKGRQGTVQSNTLPTPMVADMPLVALDMYTRVGKSCLRQLQQQVDDLKPYSTQQIGMGVFYLEAALVDKQLVSPLLESLTHDAWLADSAGAGLAHTPDIIALRGILQQHLGLLQTIRQAQLADYLAPPPDQLDLGQLNLGGV